MGPAGSSPGGLPPELELKDELFAVSKFRFFFAFFVYGFAFVFFVIFFEGTQHYPQRLGQRVYVERELARREPVGGGSRRRAIESRGDESARGG